MEKSKNYSTIILIITGFVLFLGGAFYLGRQSIQQKEINRVEEKVTPADEPTAEPTIAEIVSSTGWKTYIGPNGYQIKYPKDWVIKADPQQDPNDSKTAGFSMIKGDYKIQIPYVEAYGPGICIFSDNPDFGKNYPESPGYHKCPGKFVDVNGDFNFRRKETSNMSPQGGASGAWSIFTKDKDGNFVTVPPVSYQTPKDFDPQIVKEMDQILATLKLIGNENIINSWKTYDGDGFQLKYPKNWTAFPMKHLLLNNCQKIEIVKSDAAQLELPMMDYIKQTYGSSSDVDGMLKDVNDKAKILFTNISSDRTAIVGPQGINEVNNIFIKGTEGTGYYNIAVTYIGPDTDPNRICLGSIEDEYKQIISSFKLNQ